MSDSRSDQRIYLGVGAAFVALAVAMWLTMDSWAIALPFAAIAVTFLILGTQSKAGPKKAPGSDKNHRA